MACTEDQNPQPGLLPCPHCGGGLHITELYITNPTDPKRAMVYFLPGEAGVELGGILDDQEYRIEPGEGDGEGDRPGCMLALLCRDCQRTHAYDIRFERDGRTAFYWDAPGAVPGSR